MVAFRQGKMIGNDVDLHATIQNAWNVGDQLSLCVSCQKRGLSLNRDDHRESTNVEGFIDLGSVKLGFTMYYDIILIY